MDRAVLDEQVAEGLDSDEDDHGKDDTKPFQLVEVARLAGPTLSPFPARTATGRHRGFGRSARGRFGALLWLVAHQVGNLFIGPCRETAGRVARGHAATTPFQVAVASLAGHRATSE
jgi:hypothetical protein